MKITVHETGASSWERIGLSLYKRVSLRTSIGKRDQDIAINYHRSDNGRLLCLLTFFFDFELIPGAEDWSGQWCTVTMEAGRSKGGAGAFQFSVRDGRSLLTSDDHDVQKLFFSLFSRGEWMASVRGREDIIWQFPIPFDETFNPMIKSLAAEAAN